MLSTALGFPGDISHCSVLALEDPGFLQGFASTMISKRFGEIGYKSVLLNVIENMKYRWLIFYLSLLFTHLLKGPWRMRGWNQK